MEKALFLTGLALLGLAAPGTGAASPTTPPAAATAPEAAPAPPRAPTAEELEASRQAIAGADVQRLVRDRAYAAMILPHIDRLAALAANDTQARLALDNLRLFALFTQQRPDAVRATIDDVLAQRPTEGAFYAGAWFGALSIDDLERAVTVAEMASRNVSGVGWPDLRRIFEQASVNPLLGRLHADHREAQRVRLAAALFRIGWPGAEDVETADYLRSILIEDRVRAHDDSTAAGYAAGIVTPGELLPMMVQTRYDAILAPGRDRLALLQEGLAQRDRDTSAALAAAPRDMRRVLDRVHYLRGVGRDADALALVMPFTRDLRATVFAQEEGKWLINDGAYALIALGRNDDALALLRRLTALPIDQDWGLVSQFINQAEILVDTGHYAEALERARTLERDDGEHASAYGKMWISAAIVCSLAGLNRAAEAAPEVARMRDQREVNPAALTRAYVCLGDDDAAAASIVHRLESDEPDSAILALQTYTLSRGASQQGRLYDRLMALRDRRDVRDALARVGRLYTLPLARTTWAGF